MTIDRKKAPNFREIEHINIPKIEKQTLSNGTKLHIIDGGSQDIIKVDWVYKAGLYYQDKPLVSSMTNLMLSEGTKSYNSHQLAEIFDFHGAYNQSSFSQHFGQLSLISLNKHMDMLLPVFEEMVKMPTFPEKEIEVNRTNKKNSYLVNMEKTSTMARRKLMEVMFGSNHSYANLIELDDFDKFTREDLIDFYKRQYIPGDCEIIVSGKVTDNILKSIDELFGKYGKELPLVGERKQHISPCTEKHHHVTKSDSVQSTIKIGRTLINKTHEEYNKLKVLNIILGGYFGSRLMSNIREEKGYTYGIHSSLSSMPDSGYFAISTDVGNDVREAALKEIYKEIERLQVEFVPDEELMIVKNYITSELLRTFDGPFSISEVVRGDLAFDVKEDHYKKFLKDIKSVTPEELKYLANKYLCKDDLYEIVAGV